VTPLAKKRLWSVEDFAEWLGCSKKEARRILKSENAELGGKLILVTKGSRGSFRFLVARLFAEKPEYALTIESLKSDVETLKEGHDDLLTRVNATMRQCGQNTRDIAHLRARRKAG
jgi:hypothetical protein